MEIQLLQLQIIQKVIERIWKVLLFEIQGLTFGFLLSSSCSLLLWFPENFFKPNNDFYKMSEVAHSFSTNDSVLMSVFYIRKLSISIKLVFYIFFYIFLLYVCTPVFYFIWKVYVTSKTRCRTKPVWPRQD